MGRNASSQSSAKALELIKNLKGSVRSITNKRGSKSDPKVFSEDAETGKDLTPKKVKEKTAGKKSEYITITNLYSDWRGLVCRNIGVDLIAERAVGSDYGHLKNLINFFGCKAKAFEAIELLVTRWKDVQKKFSIATKKDTPSLYLADTLKNDLLAVMCGKSSLTGDVGGSHRADGQRSLIGKTQEEVEAYYNDYKRVKDDN